MLTKQRIHIIRKRTSLKKPVYCGQKSKNNTDKIAEYIASAPKRQMVKKQSTLTFATKKNIVDT